MLERREWDGTPQDLLYATACAVFHFSAASHPECREMLKTELLEWIPTARTPTLGDLGLPEPAW